MEMTYKLHAPAAVLLRNNSDTHWIGGRVGTTAGLGCFGKEKNFLPVPELQAFTVQTVAVAVTKTLSWFLR